jgi:hypothetical protein
MVRIEAWCSTLLNERGLEGFPDEDRVILTVPDEHLDFLRHDSLQSTCSSLCLSLPSLQLVFINWDSLRCDFATRVLDFRLSSWLFL